MKRFLLGVTLACATLVAQEHPAAPKEHEVGAPNKGTAETVEEPEAHGGTRELMWKWVNFAILAGGLGFIAVKAGGPFFRNRSVEIRKGIEEAAVLKADAERRAAEIEARLQNIGADIEDLRKHSQVEMRTEGERIRQETAAEIAKIQARAEQEIASAAKHASQDLKVYSAELALNLAEGQIRNRMNPQTQHGLVNGFLHDLEHPSKAERN